MTPEKIARFAELLKRHNAAMARRRKVRVVKIGPQSRRDTVTTRCDSCNEFVQIEAGFAVVTCEDAPRHCKLMTSFEDGFERIYVTGDEP